MVEPLHLSPELSRALADPRSLATLAPEAETARATSVGALTEEVRAVLGRLTEESNAVLKASGLGCRSGCGACCLTPGIEARPLELLPLATALEASGDAEAAYAAATADPGGICVFYQRTEGSAGERGRCGVYALRPALCRLFGAAGVRTKGGVKALACKVQKLDMPEAVAAAEDMLVHNQGPLAGDFGMALSSLAPGSALAEPQPFNRALVVALEKVALASR